MPELKKSIDEASSVLVLLPPEASDTHYLAALQIQKIAPDKITMVAPEAKEREWHEVFGDSQHKKEFAITIDTSISPVEELRYQREGSLLTIFLTHSHIFNKTAVRMGEHLPAADLIISIGFSEQSAADQAIEALPRQTAVRHIWINENGHANGTPQIFHRKLSTSRAALLGRLMVRSREDSVTGTLWTFITREDFTRTGTTPNEIIPLFETFSEIAVVPGIAALFWQYEETTGTEGILWSNDPLTLGRLAGALGTSPINNHFIRLGHFSNFIEAETKIRKLLREQS